MSSKNLITALLCCSLLANVTIGDAAIDGWYIGGEGGYSTTDYTAKNQGYRTFRGMRLGPTPTKEEDEGAGGGFLIGKQFNKNLSTELSYTRFANAYFDNIYGITHADLKLQPQSINWVFKAMLPFFEHYNVFLKGGTTYVHTRQVPNSIAKMVILPNRKYIREESNSRFAGIYGFGASMDLSRCLSMNVAWTQTSDSIRDIERATITTLGINYHFDCHVYEQLQNEPF